MKKNFSFDIEKKVDGTLARAGVIQTPHGEILTPAFVTVGTKGTVKSLSPEMVKSALSQVVLANTYHLYLQPGSSVVQESGGLGKFMGWDGPTMTDSGGFQVFSLGSAFGKGINKVTKALDPSFQIPERSSADDGVPKLATVGNDGVSFRSHIDGSLHFISPEKSIEIQNEIGADIIFAFDECTSPVDSVRYQREALERTHRWALRSLQEMERFREKNTNREYQAIFGVIQGGREEDLRKESAKAISEMKTENGTMFDGYGIGGSFAKEDMETAVRWVNEILPEDKPRHLLGIGEPEDLFMGVENGVDLFDCVLPTRNARNGSLFTSYGKINILNSEHQNSFVPIEEGCGCYTCSPRHGGAGFTRAYLAHLFRGKEMLAGTLATVHNLYFLNNLVAKIREAILLGTFEQFKTEFLEKYLKNS